MITFLESLWYTNRKKNIPFTFLEKYLDEKTLAWWYLDDGHLKIENGKPKKIILSTDNFTHEENQLLIMLLQNKFSLYFAIDGQNRLILYDQLQIYYFYRLIEPYLHSSMNRKMLHLHEKINKRYPKRTTIYLSNYITILKPTFEINKQLNCLPKIYEIVNYRRNYLSFYNKYLLDMRHSEKTKSYQIIIKREHWAFIKKIKQLTGLNNSQIVTVCFNIDF